MSEHPSPEVRRALVALNDALCSWERDSSVATVLILRDSSGIAHRSVSGKTVQDTLGISDKSLFDAYLTDGQEA